MGNEEVLWYVTAMHQESCPSPSEHSDKGYIINCAGEKVPVSGVGFTSRCAIGNTDDYLKNFQRYVNADIVAAGKPASIIVVVPSYASRWNRFYQTLLSLALQEYPLPAEILIFINEPEAASGSAREVNDHNENFVRSLGKGMSPSRAPALLKDAKQLFVALSKNKGRLTLRCVRQVMSGGLAGVYQTVMASLIARVRTFCDQTMVGCTRPEKVKGIAEYLKNSLLLFCDDDMEIKEKRAVATGYEQAVWNNAVVLGRLQITDTDSSGEARHVLRDLMQLFFDFKYDCGLNFLSPRGILLEDILRVGGVNFDQPFSDQLFFAKASKGKKIYLVDARTTIGESNYPGNGKFLKDLRLYLAGEDNDALEIFENVLKRYEEENHRGKYNPGDIKRLILMLRTRDINKISAIVSEFLLRT